VTSPDPAWGPGKPRVVVLGPTEESITERLMAHLSGLFNPRWGFCDGWTPGSGSSDSEVNARLSTADLAVLVTGPGTPIEVMEALQARRPELRVVPVIARRFDMSSTPLGSLVCVPRDKPVASYYDEDEALAQVASDVKGLCKSLQAKYAAKAEQPVSPPVPAPDPPTDQWHNTLRLVRAAARPDTAEDFARAVMSAFDRSALTAVIWHGLSVCLADVVQPGGLREQVLGLHGWLVRNGRLDEFVNEAVRRNPGDPTLAAYARQRKQNAHDALQANVNAPAKVLTADVVGIAAQLGLDRDRIDQARLQALHDADKAAPGDVRRAVYDRLSRMLPSQLSVIAMKFGMPSAWSPGPTASTSDHAIAIIRWAEQNGQMQRLLDAEATAQKVGRY